ncbi:MAG: hypothetical protein ACLQD9_06530 [Thermoplasmata archaeon]
MSAALVLGERGSGLTTFVGLLYTAQVRLGTDESDEFRFHAERESIRQLETIYGELGAGRFPTHDANWEDRPLSFVFGFRQGKLRGLAHRETEPDTGFDTVEVQVSGMLTDVAAELRDNNAVLDPSTRRSLRSQVVVPLIDASSLAPPPRNGDPLPVSDRDRLLAGTLDLLGKFLAAEPDRKARRLFPLFVVTKSDRVQLETLRRLDAPSGVPAEWTPEARRALGGRLLRTYFPETSKFLESHERGAGLVVAAPEWYFSGLGTEATGGELRIQRRSRAPVGGWEPVYPFDEYRALIETLGKIAHRLPSGSAG